MFLFQKTISTITSRKDTVMLCSRFTLLISISYCNTEEIAELIFTIARSVTNLHCKSGLSQSSQDIEFRGAQRVGGGVEGSNGCRAGVGIVLPLGVSQDCDKLIHRLPLN